MDLELAGRTALVTGGSQGIGRATALTLAQEGCHLRLAARDAAALDEVAQLARQEGVRVHVHPCDLSQAGAAGQLAAQCDDADILVNNAGAIPRGSLLQVGEESWRDAWELKVFGYINLCRAMLGPMLERGSGVIVNVIGLGGERPDGGYIAGSAGNAALMAFTRGLGASTIDQGVRVVGINPGAVMTERLVTLTRQRAEQRWGDAERWRELLEAMNLPRGRAATPREIADVVAFVASERASYISGTVITVDGGTAHRPA
jgi:NAD(P)-dependent dehydrogenase (short-subunit alcohol dehydrogenase family)